jgi:hypothetical protein
MSLSGQISMLAGCWFANTSMQNLISTLQTENFLEPYDAVTG